MLSRTFKSLKAHKSFSDFRPKSSIKPPKSLKLVSSSSISGKESPSNSISLKKSWSVYLILSTNPPIKTYVGVTTNFSRRLKQHNGELKGGAKASHAGRPWVCACLIQGFHGKSEACEFESKWKTHSRKLPRKRKSKKEEEQVDDNSSLPLLQHRHAALNRVKNLVDCSHLEIIWHFDLS
ncbi:hypothetical protein M9H77_02785 [Catharanthus roseus]|uniref:Uncharacterized protein n=1 Tax=Catharanthus roseus TaxID=4058 RepID=A0ACC0C9K2_CATRO|nr:hypothetical protein M9H77_02785 [Catharanthus roseus]